MVSGGPGRGDRFLKPKSLTLRNGGSRSCQREGDTQASQRPKEIRCHGITPKRAHGGAGSLLFDFLHRCSCRQLQRGVSGQAGFL